MQLNQMARERGLDLRPQISHASMIMGMNAVHPHGVPCMGPHSG